MSNDPRLRPTRSGRRPGRERNARERRVLGVALAVSLILHVIAIGVVSQWLEPSERDLRTVALPRPAEPDPTMQAVALSDREPPETEVTLPDQPPRQPVERRPARQQATEGQPAAVAPRDRRTAAERLAPRIVEPGLWSPRVILPREPTLQDVQDRVAAAIEMLSDSALADAERALRARDWTVEDASGGRWGISPGKLHLGSVTLPLPIYFPTDMEQEAQNRLWLEVDTQADRAAILQSFDERVRAIRARRDRERAEDRRGQ